MTKIKIKNYLLFVIALFILFPVNTLAMKMYVKQPDGTTLTLEVESSDEIPAVKRKIKEQNNIPVENQILMFGDRILEDVRTLGDYNIPKESTIQLIFSNIKYQITTNLINISTNTVTEITNEEDYKLTLVPNTNCKLPSTIEIKIGSNLLDTSKYSYNNETGEITIPKEVIRGNIEITAEGIVLPPPTGTNINLTIITLIILSLIIIIKNKQISN